MRLILLSVSTLLAVSNGTAFEGGCSVPSVVRGQWFTLEQGEAVSTTFSAESMSQRGLCTDMVKENRVNYTIVFHNVDSQCFYCVKIIVRTVNVLEKMETGCMTLPIGTLATVENVCQHLKNDQQLVTLFSENFRSINCRSSLEGVWQFAYRNRFRFTGECNHPEARIKSCQTAGAQFFITNQKFTMTFKTCANMLGTADGAVDYTCLGDWYVDKNHYFAVANTRESRKEEKFRCFLKNRDDDSYMGMSNTAECSTLINVENSPVILRVTPIEAQVVAAGCRLPMNFSGDWVNTANSDAEVSINETHIVETVYPYEGRFLRTVYICQEQRDNRYMMARLSVDGCQTDYICYEFLPRHQNIIRFRKGQSMIKDHFQTVCSWVRFPNDIKWKYDLMLAKHPIPVRCPVAGKYQFTQRGAMPFVTRILGGLTQSPRPNINCKQNISDFSVCDTDQKEIWIDENYCLSVDHLGRPIDIYSDPDYKMKCIGYWKENLKSYLITYDESDAFSYRCWVYQRTDLNKILISQSIGSFCDMKQDITSWRESEGAAVGLELEEYERERDQCPMYFDDGSNPWLDETDASLLVLNVGSASQLKVFSRLIFILTAFNVMLFWSNRYA